MLVYYFLLLVGSLNLVFACKTKETITQSTTNYPKQISDPAIVLPEKGEIFGQNCFCLNEEGCLNGGTCIRTRDFCYCLCKQVN